MRADPARLIANAVPDPVRLAALEAVLVPLRPTARRDKVAVGPPEFAATALPASPVRTGRPASLASVAHAQHSWTATVRGSMDIHRRALLASTAHAVPARPIVNAAADKLAPKASAACVRRMPSAGPTGNAITASARVRRISNAQQDNGAEAGCASRCDARASALLRFTANKTEGLFFNWAATGSSAQNVEARNARVLALKRAGSLSAYRRLAHCRVPHGMWR